MIGDLHIVGEEIYLQINKEGTLQKIDAQIPWYKKIYIYLKQRFCPMGANELAKWFSENCKNNEVEK